VYVLTHVLSYQLNSQPFFIGLEALPSLNIIQSSSSK